MIHTLEMCGSQHTYTYTHKHLSTANKTFEIYIVHLHCLYEMECAFVCISLAFSLVGIDIFLETMDIAAAAV